MSGDATELLVSFFLGQVVDLIDDLLGPGLKSLDLLRHKTKLVSDDRLLDELLAKGFALCGPGQGIFETSTCTPQALEDDPETLVVEITHDVSEALTLGANQILHWDLDVLQDHIGRGRQTAGADFDLAGADALYAGDEEKRDSLCAWTAGADGSLTNLLGTSTFSSWKFGPHHEIIGVHAVGDPVHTKSDLCRNLKRI